MGQKTRQPGVRTLGDGKYELRAKVVDPKTGKVRNLVRVVEAADARDAAAQRLALRSGWLSERRPRARSERLSLLDSAERWAADRRDRLKHSTRQTYREALTRWCEHLGDHYLDQLEPHEVAAVLATWRAAGLSADTCNGRLRVLRTLTREMGAPQVVEGVRALPRSVREDEDSEDEGRGLSLPELRAFLEAAPSTEPAWWPLLATLAWTGLRYSEASSLEWADVDFAQGTLRVRRGQVDGRVGRTKAVASVRTTVMPDDLVAVLRAHRARQMEGTAIRFELDRRELVFPSDRCHQVSRSGKSASPYRSDSACGRAAVRCYEAAGIRLDGRPRLHSLRHSYNNALRQVASELVRQSMVGHADAEIGKRYSKASIDEKRAATAAWVRLVRSE